MDLCSNFPLLCYYQFEHTTGIEHSPKLEMNVMQIGPGSSSQIAQSIL
jgi:hypothetical protein